MTTSLTADTGGTPGVPATNATEALRRLPLPLREPPYDDEVAATSATRWDPPDRAHHELPTMTQGTLALAFVLPSGLDAAPAPPPGLRLLANHSAADVADEMEFGPQPTPRVELPEPRQWAARLVQGLVEVLAGERPPAQLVRWTTREVYDDVSRSVRHGGAGARPVVRSVHVSEPADGIAEVAALVRRGIRCSAIAVRLEGLDGRWQCTAIELG